jgi:hypothetical protein
LPQTVLGYTKQALNSQYFSDEMIFIEPFLVETTADLNKLNRAIRVLEIWSYD